ncbi:MAG: hypothetical protein KAY24_05900 [Candidatus Eisenbacteria sp.]|nr:hypothetical protein [Candidatus Eisenbacteria bacterium]
MMKEMRILIVDDDPGVRDAYQEILSPGDSVDVAAKGAALFGGTPVSEAPSPPRQYDLALAERGEVGIDAVKAALEQHRPFAVAFVDMKMPGIDGAETTREI